MVYWRSAGSIRQQGIAERINGGTLEQSQLSPIRPTTAALGRVTALALEGLAVAVVVAIAFIALFGLHYDPHPSAIVPALLTVLDAIGYGLVIVAMTIRVASIGAITHVFNMAIMFFGGMLVPIAVFPDGVEAVARLIPTALGVQALNTTLAGEPLSATWSDGTLPLRGVQAACGGQGPHGGQGLRHGRRGRGGVPLPSDRRLDPTAP